MNKDLWLLVGGITVGLFGIGLLGLFFSLMKLCKSISLLFKSRILLESINFLGKSSWRHYFETNIRAETGKALERPYGTSIHHLSWENILLNPVYLTKKPLTSDVKIGTSVTLGPQAIKPLQLKIPIMIAGMSYGGALSFKAMIALAKASTMAGSVVNTGSGPLLAETRAIADNYILQFSRGFWAKSEAILQQADMIEISLGHGAWGPAPVRIKGQKVINGFAKRVATISGLDLLLEARLPEVENISDWQRLILDLKKITGGVPIAVKIGGTHLLEQELDYIFQGNIDVLAIDGTEGGTHAGPQILLDDVGLPTLPTLCRTVNYIQQHRLSGKVSLIVGGGLATPGDFLKCMALGADAVFVGTITSLAMSHTQVTKTIPWEPPTGLIYFHGKEEKKYDPDMGAKHLNNYLQSCVKEMEETARTLGKQNLKEINKSDLVALDQMYARMAGIDLQAI